MLSGLKRHAEALDDAGGAERGRLHESPADVAREVGVDVTQVREVLARLGRMGIATEDETGAIVVMDLPRLMEFMELIEMPRKGEA